jgi:hypothetical protein
VVLEVPGEAIELVDYQAVDARILGQAGEHRLELRPGRRFGADAYSLADPSWAGFILRYEGQTSCAMMPPKSIRPSEKGATVG